MKIIHKEFKRPNRRRVANISDVEDGQYFCFQTDIGFTRKFLSIVYLREGNGLKYINKDKPSRILTHSYFFFPVKVLAWPDRPVTVFDRNPFLDEE